MKLQKSVHFIRKAERKSWTWTVNGENNWNPITLHLNLIFISTHFSSLVSSLSNEEEGENENINGSN